MVADPRDVMPSRRSPVTCTDAYMIGTPGTNEYKKAVLPCRLNPAFLMCTCKGYKHHGICSHVLALNHILKEINLRREVMEIGASSSRKGSSHHGFKRVGGGNRHKAIPALTRAPTREADSSDEEQERLLELGNDGR